MAALLCVHRPLCPGCPRLGDASPPPALERLAALARQHGVPSPELVRGPERAMRRRARLAIGGRADAPKLGIFQRGTHQVVHVPECLVHHPVINAVAAEVREALGRRRIPTYSGAAHAGVARYLQVVVERQTDRAQVVLVTNGETPDAVASVLEELARPRRFDLHSLWWNGNPQRQNTILGPYWRHLAGPPAVEDRSGDARVFYPPGAFGQSNLELATELAERVRSQAAAGERVVELFAGVGAIGLGLASRAGALTLNELAPASLAGLELGVAALSAEVRARVTVQPGPAAEAAHVASTADLLIVDPPRKGLEPELALHLEREPPRRLVYVSCGIDSFERDAAALLRAGRLRLTSLAAYDLFPYTEHVETLATFERA